MPGKTKKRNNGDGHVRKRKDGRWELIYMAGYKADGVPNRKSVFGKTQKEAKDKYDLIKHSLSNGTYVEPSKLKVGAWLNEWLETYKMPPKVSASTYSGYESNIRLHITLAIGNILLKDLRAEHIQRLYDGVAKKLSGRMAQLVHVTLHGALKQALKTDRIARNYSESVDIPKHTKKESRVLTIDEQQAFTNSISGDRHETAFLLYMFTGLRRGELLGLQWANVDFKENTIKVVQSLGRQRNFDPNIKTKTVVQLSTPKTKTSNRIITMFTEVVQMLKAHKARQPMERLQAGSAWNDSNFVFCTELGRYIDTTTLTEYFNAAITKAGIPKANLHALRHSFATRGLENGLELKVISELLGHSTLALTSDLYAHVLLDKKRESMEKLRGLFQATVN